MSFSANDARSTPLTSLSDYDEHVAHECIKCIKTIMNLTVSIYVSAHVTLTCFQETTSIQEIVNSLFSIATFVGCFKFDDACFLPPLLEVLAALCIVSSDAHWMIVDELQGFAVEQLIAFVRNADVKELQVSVENALQLRGCLLMNV